MSLREFARNGIKYNRGAWEVGALSAAEAVGESIC
jgi:hypothetical protein